MADKTYTWDDDFLSENPNKLTGLVGTTGDYINDTRKAVTERHADEHFWDINEPAPQTNMGAHKAGSAKGYYGAGAPTLRPDGVTTLDVNDAGRLWYDSASAQIKGWNGSAWVNLSVPGQGTILRWQPGAQYEQYEIVEYEGNLWIAQDDPPTVGVPPAETMWKLFSISLPNNVAWFSQHTYSPSEITHYNGVWWIAVSPVQGSAPGAVGGEWNYMEMGTNSIADDAVTQAKIGPQAVGTDEIQDGKVITSKYADLSVTTAKLENKNVTYTKLADDTYKTITWRDTLAYPQGAIAQYSDTWYVNTAVSSTVGVPPADTSGDWIRWTEHTSELLTANGTVAAGRPLHNVFCDTSGGGFEVTISDGRRTGDFVVIAAYGGNNVTITATGVSQSVLNQALMYVWTGALWLAVGGAGGGGAGVSLGEITWWPAAGGIPDGKVVCDGSIVNIADYPELFGVLGTTWGGNGSTTFGLPDIRGIAPGHVGTHGTLGNTTPGSIGDYNPDSFGSHTHVQNSHNHTQNSHNHSQNSHTHTQNAHNHTQVGHNHVQGLKADETITHALYGYTTISHVGNSLRANNADLDNFPYTSTVTPTINNTTAVNQSATAVNNAATAVNQATTATNQNTGGADTRPAYAVGRWLIQAAPPAPSEINAVVVDVEIGSVRWWGSDTVGSYDLICNGQGISTTEYPELFAILGYTYGGSGGTFNVPNLQGVMPGAQGTQDVNGRTKGDATLLGAYREDQIQELTGEWHGSGPAGIQGLTTTGVFYAGTPQSIHLTGSGGSANQVGFRASNVARTGDYTRPTELIGHWIIRAKQPASYVIPGLPELLEAVFPVGSVYTQLPNKKTPAELGYPGTWSNISSEFAGDFFRAEGGNASAFESGQQANAMEDHRHAGGYGHSSSGNLQNYGSRYIASGGREGSGFTTGPTYVPWTDYVDGASAGSETRPVNRTVRIWERTA